MLLTFYGKIKNDTVFNLWAWLCYGILDIDDGDDIIDSVTDYDGGKRIRGHRTYVYNYEYYL